MYVKYLKSVKTAKKASKRDSQSSWKGEKRRKFEDEKRQQLEAKICAVSQVNESHNKNTICSRRAATDFSSVVRIRPRRAAFLSIISEEQQQPGSSNN